jgi:hypothetical protein
MHRVLSAAWWHHLVRNTTSRPLRVLSCTRKSHRTSQSRIRHRLLPPAVGKQDAIERKQARERRGLTHDVGITPAHAYWIKRMVSSTTV